MSGPISNFNLTPNAAVAAVASEPNKTKEAINDKVAVANVKNAKENTIQEKNREGNQNRKEKEEKERKDNIESISHIVSPTINTAIQNESKIEVLDGFKRYKKAIEAYQNPEESQE